MTQPPLAASPAFTGLAALPADDAVLACLDLPGMRGFALDALLSLGSIEWCDDVDSAAVECVAHPRLLLNRGFVARHCHTAGHLLALLLHEMAHISLGHTRLYPRPTLAHNLAFDAIINQLVVCAVQAAGGPVDEVLEFFCEILPSDRSPLFLLRPPRDWPSQPAWEDSVGLPADLRSIHRRLWSTATTGRTAKTAHDVTYGEILEALRTNHPELAAPVALALDDDTLDELVRSLLGSHGRSDGEQRAEHGDRDGRTAMLLPRLIESLKVRGGQNLLGHAAQQLAIQQAQRREETVRALRALCRKVFASGSARNDVIGVSARDSLSVDRSRDRRAFVRDAVARRLGTPRPLLFTTPMLATAREPGTANVYLDVSGSMAAMLPVLHAALVPLRRQLRVTIHCFSTVVSEVSGAAFDRGRVLTTGGTDIAPPLEHALARRRQGGPRTVLIVTDGEFVAPKQSLVAELRRAGVEVHLGIAGFGPTHHGAAWVASSSRIPAVHTFH